MLSYNDVCVIIRSTGERTEQVSYQILTKIFSNENVQIIRGMPFRETLKKGLEVGKASEKKWVLHIDADVLVHVDGIVRLLERAGSLPDNIFEIQGLVIDKLIPIKRPAGNHLYKRKYIGNALDHLRNIENSLRPETRLLNKMRMNGYDWVQSDDIIGIHDYEQYYEDIMCKAFLHAKKHKSYLAIIEDYWQDKQNSDQDFYMAMWGSFIAKLNNDFKIYDRNLIKQEITPIVRFLEIEEKQEINDLSGIEAQINSLIKTYDSNSCTDFKKIYYIKKSDINNSTNKWNKKIESLIRRIFFKFGKELQNVGEKIKYIAQGY